MAGSVSIPDPFTDAAGIWSINSLLGDKIVAERRAVVSGVFNYNANLPNEQFQPVLRWTTSGGAGVLVVDELVRGGTSNAVGLLEVVASPSRIRTLRGLFVTGETITGDVSAATRVITVLAGNGILLGAPTIGQVLLTTGAGTTNTVALESAEPVFAQPGWNGWATFAVQYTGGSAATSSQYTGPLSTSAGFGIGFENTVAGAVRRNFGVDTFTAQTAFNIDVLDGSSSATNPSGITLSLTAAPTSFMLQWDPVTGSVWWWILDTLGRWWPFHRITAAVSGTAFLSDPHLPMRAEAAKTAGATNLQIALSGWAAGFVGPQTLARRRLNSAYNTTAVSLPAIGTETPIVSIKNTVQGGIFTAGGGTRNRCPIRLVSCIVRSDSTSVNATLLRLRRNVILTGEVFAVLPAPTGLNSTVFLDITATAITAGNSEIVHMADMASRNASTELVGEEGIILYPGETLTLTGAANSLITNALAHMRWEEMP